MTRLIAAGMLWILAPLGVAAQSAPAADEEATHDALRALRDGVMEAINNKDVDSVLRYLHPEIVFTAMNAETCRGHDQVRAYYERMLTGPDKVVDDVSYDLTVDSLSILYGGDTAVAYGSSADHYRLTSGMELDFKTRWSATVVKEDGRWLIASFQHGTSPFENPVLDAVKSTLRKVGIGGALFGLLGGVIVGRLTKRRRA